MYSTDLNFQEDREDGRSDGGVTDCVNDVTIDGVKDGSIDATNEGATDWANPPVQHKHPRQTMTRHFFMRYYFTDKVLSKRIFWGLL
ncbi:MAG TPA: hypothetical protein VNS58_06470 [Puia sp.]|nr:hypothetical protein [Puia sp.]